MNCGYVDDSERSLNSMPLKCKPIAKRATQLLTVLLVAGAISTADEWPQFRGNAQLTGVTAEKLPSTLKPLWTYEAGDSIESSAAIADGTVYVGSQSSDLLAVD